jgi:hypothetical protein
MYWFVYEEASILQSSFWRNYGAVNNAAFNDTTSLGAVIIYFIEMFWSLHIF